jgi:hypothetical protein
LIIKAALHFSLIFNKYEFDEEMKRVTPLDPVLILECKSLKDLFSMAIRHFKQSLLGDDEDMKLEAVLSYILVSRKGITEAELFELIPNLSETHMNRVMSVFGFLMVKEKDFIFIKHASFHKAIKESLTSCSNQEAKMILHRNIATVIEKQAFSLRQVDELSHQYFFGKCWIKLKDLISNIEVFSIMFVPETKQ